MSKKYFAQRFLSTLQLLKYQRNNEKVIELTSVTSIEKADTKY